MNQATADTGPYVLGVDGGNTKTLAIIARVDGRVCGYGRSGCGDIYGARSPAVALDTVQQAVQAALAMAQCPPERVQATCFSMAGADWPEDYALLQQNLSTAHYGGLVQVVNDAVGALVAGSPSGWGVAAVCGTFSTVGARTRDGRIWHTSFWHEGYFGGAQALGKAATDAVFRAELGLGPPTLLTARILECEGQPDVVSLLHSFTRREHPAPHRFGLYAKLLLDTAQAGDDIARGIVREHGQRVASYVLAAARQVGLRDEPFPLIFTGGVFRHPCRLLGDTILQYVWSENPSVKAVYSTWEPVFGAVFLALRSAAAPVTPVVCDRLRATSPPPSFFHTET